MPHRYYVYAVQLDPAAARHAADQALVRQGADVYYVGQTGLDDTRRLQAHFRGGGKSNGSVRRWARRVAGHVGPFTTRTEAERRERAWARRIRKLGHVVIGGH